jgi:hypothetical protein
VTSVECLEMDVLIGDCCEEVGMKKICKKEGIGGS